ncbi:hypothetical protein MASR1M66_21360 [Aminivibrio sp.]
MVRHVAEGVAAGPVVAVVDRFPRAVEVDADGVQAGAGQAGMASGEACVGVDVDGALPAPGAEEPDGLGDEGRLGQGFAFASWPNDSTFLARRACCSMTSTILRAWGVKSMRFWGDGKSAPSGWCEMQP